MAYNVIIGEEIVLSKCIESINCIVDSPNDTNARSSFIDNHIIITGSIGTSESTIELYNWAKLNIGSDKTYRSLVVEINDDNGNKIRKINFPNAFVVDYSESFSSASGLGMFSLFIKQKKDKNDEITVEEEVISIESLME